MNGRRARGVYLCPRQLGDLEPDGGLLVLEAHGGGWRRVRMEREALVYAAGNQLNSLTTFCQQNKGLVMKSKG